jgi:hypothetical protein
MKRINILAMVFLMTCTVVSINSCKKSKSPCPPDMHERIMPNGARICVPDWI